MTPEPQREADAFKRGYEQGRFDQKWTGDPPGAAPRWNVERLAEALMNEDYRRAIEGGSYPADWRKRAERLAGEYARLERSKS